MRLGRVEYKVSYLVDLDNEQMVSQAKDWIVQDVNEFVRWGADDPDVYITIAPPYPTDSPANIPSALVEEEYD